MPDLRQTEIAAAGVIGAAPDLRPTELSAAVVLLPAPPLRLTAISTLMIVPNTGVVVPWHLFFNTDLGAF